MILHETIDDFRKRYKDAFVFLNLNEEKILAQYDSDKEGSFLFTSPVFGEIRLDLETTVNTLGFVFPTSGMYNVDGESVLFTRVPARQWKRAPHKDNCQITSVFNNCFYRKPKLLTCEALEQIYYTKYPKSLEEAIKLDRDSIAVNNKFSVTISNKENHILWYKQTPIGYIDVKNRSIIIKTNLLFQETLDFIKKKEPTWTLI